MKMYYSMRLQGIISMLALFLSFSCSYEKEGRKPEFPYGVVDVNFSVSLPEPQSIGSRSFTDMDIKNVDVLVFDQDAKFLKRIKVEKDKLTPTSTGVSFTVRLDATPDRRTIHLVANGREPNVGATDRVNFSSLSVGMTEQNAMSALKTILPSGWNTLSMENIMMPLVMWSRFTLPSVNAVTKVQGVKLLRAAACVKVNMGSGVTDFTINRVTLHKSFATGYVTPANPVGVVEVPSVARPDASAPQAAYDRWWVAGSAPLYTYERNCTTADYLGVIIEGTYKGQKGYYKVVVSNPAGQPLSIIRNHRYNITVIGVNGPGYQQIATALNSAPSNDLKVNISVQDPDLPIVLGDSQYWMAASNNELAFYAKRPNQLPKPAFEFEDLCKLYSSRNITPVLSSNKSWLTGLRAVPRGGGKFDIYGKVVNPPSGSDDEAVLTVKCDNLILNLRVFWKRPNPQSVSVSGTSYYVYKLNTGGEKDWRVELGGPSGDAYFAAASNPASAADMFKELNSKYATDAYMLIRNTSDIMEHVWMRGAYADNKTVVRRIISYYTP